MRTTIEILGCGTSTGVPLIFCSCRVCQSKNPRNKRLRASALVCHQGVAFLIDTSTDLRQQALRSKIPKIDAVCFTHSHADHVSGLDEIRSFNFKQNARIPAFAEQSTAKSLKVRFPYIFNPKIVEGGGIPLVDMKVIPKSRKSIRFKGTQFTPLWVKHGSIDCLGYRFGNLAYITDCNFIPPKTLELITGLKVLVLDCLRLSRHGTHFNLEGALEIINCAKPKRAILTHLGHDFDYPKWKKKLPKNVELAYDGLKIGD